MIMRVIAGTARRLQLKTPQGKETRPTTDRIKETLFNMLQDELCDIRFLDLFSGSGGIGIEALSRGARFAYFVEQNKSTCEIIKENLKTTHLEEKARVYTMSVFNAITALEGKETFHIVFMDPPYGKNLEKEVLRHPSFLSILEDKALVIVEADLDTVLSDGDIPGMHILKEKIYKTNKHIFLEKDS